MGYEYFERDDKSGQESDAVLRRFSEAEMEVRCMVNLASCSHTIIICGRSEDHAVAEDN